MSFVLKSLREKMRLHEVDYYWIPGSDEHFNEYVPACWQRRAFVSGFTGSCGDLLVGLEEAWLWTDSRYFLQAEAQLTASDVRLMRIGIDPSCMMFLSTVAKGCSVAFDSRLLSVDSYERWEVVSQRNDF